MDKAVQRQDQVSYCSDCKVTPVSSQGSMCDKCTEDFYAWLKWEESYSAQEREDKLQTLSREYEYQEPFHTMRF